MSAWFRYLHRPWAQSFRAARHFKGLRHLASPLQDDFVVGVLLYSGAHTLPIDDKLLAVPLAAVWEATGWLPGDRHIL